jgi:hypothetical protein
MVRHYIGKYIEDYVSHEMGLPAQLTLTAILGLVVSFVFGVLFAWQLGLVFLANTLIKVFTGSWITFSISAVAALAVFGGFAVHGLYEVGVLWSLTLASKLKPLRKLLNMLIFTLDFFLSDFLIGIAGLLLAYAYAAAGIEHTYQVLEVVLASLLVGSVGVFFQAVCVASYAKHKDLYVVVRHAKKLLLNTPGVNIPKRARPLIRTFRLLMRSAITVLPIASLLVVHWYIFAKTGSLSLLYVLLVYCVAASLYKLLTLVPHLAHEYRMHHGVAVGALYLGFYTLVGHVAVKGLVGPTPFTVAYLAMFLILVAKYLEPDY